MKIISVFDTSFSTDNIGDQIMMESVDAILYELFPDYYHFHTATHECISKLSYKWINKSDYTFVGGTNILSAQTFNKKRLWKLKLKDWFALKDILLIGAGWNKYNQKMNTISTCVWNKILHREFLHSVRDQYTLQKTQELGILNCINTGCPTLWNVSIDPIVYRTQKASASVFTLTSHKGNIVNDCEFINQLLINYKKVFFWPQDIRDLDYFMLLINTNSRYKDIIILNPNLAAFDLLLTNEEIDYVGTRLHGGIRAIQHRQRTLILGIDNRAIELTKDCNLNVLLRKNISELDKIINLPIATQIKLNYENISIWKHQFV